MFSDASVSISSWSFLRCNYQSVGITAAPLSSHIYHEKQTSERTLKHILCVSPRCRGGVPAAERCLVDLGLMTLENLRLHCWQWTLKSRRRSVRRSLGVRRGRGGGGELRAGVRAIRWASAPTEGYQEILFLWRQLLLCADVALPRHAHS